VASPATSLPLVATTLPSARMVALAQARLLDSDCVAATTGVPLVMSIV